MRSKRIRVLGALVAIVVAGFAVAALSRSGDPPAAAEVDMNHGNVRFAEGQKQRILNAADVAAASTSADERVAEGRRVFRDSSLFEEGESCQTCHAEGSASSKAGTMVHDKQVRNASPMPPTDFDGPRDPPALWGLSKTPPFFWDGDVPDLKAAILTPVLGHMAAFVPGGRGAPPGELNCETVGPDGSRSAECEERAGQIADALMAYVRTLDPPTTAFDQGTLSEAALRGEKIFQGKGGCIECHGGPLFTDNGVHNTGVPQVTFTSPYGTGTRESNDLGAGPPPDLEVCTGDEPPPGCEVEVRPNTAFINTPQLRDVKNTAPYMHNGKFKTLEEVVQFYNTNELTGGPLRLTGAEIDELVAYLKSL